MVMIMDYMETTKITNKNKSYQDYMQALLEERRKIQVFHRELPLCLDLVNQAIENCKQYVYGNERSDQCEEKEEQQQEQEHTSIEGGPVLEEFIPMKRSLSCEEEEEDKSNVDESNDNNNNNNNIGKKVDWLRSVQLWNQNPEVPPPPPPSQQQENSPIKEISVVAKESGGAFHPFPKTKPIKTVVSDTVTITVPNSVPTASTSSTADNNTRKKEEKDNQLNRKTRRCWSPELHRRFLQALQQLGGSHAATPKQIRELMKVDGLTNDEVKSHLQKYRLHTRRPGPSMHGNGNTTAAQFVVVGGIWVPPQDYTPATTNVNAPSADSEKIYVPVATTSQLTLSLRQQQQQQQQQKQHKQSELSTGSSHSERKSSLAEHSTVDKNGRSSSPAVTSSSTETTTASPKF